MFNNKECIWIIKYSIQLYLYVHTYIYMNTKLYFKVCYNVYLKYVCAMLNL